jgi:putative RecB family exonuclease
VSLPLPTSLTPSKVSAFTDCALAFRFSAIDHLPEPPTQAAVRGSLVHRALQRMMWEHEPGQRTLDAGLDCLAGAVTEFAGDPEFVALGLDTEAAGALADAAAALVRNYFILEDPNTVNAIGMELQLEATVGDLTLRGIIDRLDLDSDGELVITDYKTGRAPMIAHERRRLDGVRFYAFLCERVLGRRPSRVQLLYLGDPLALIATPSEQSVRGLERRTRAVWTAIERACVAEDFRPKPSRLCDWCAFKAYCPAFGGDPTLAVRAEQGDPTLTAPAEQAEPARAVPTHPPAA